MPRLMPTLLTLLAMATGSAHAGNFELQVAGGERAGHLAERFSYDRHGCSGQNLVPALRWQGAPAGTRSFAISMIDPDAPRKDGFRHWFVLDLPADTRNLPQGGNLPPGAYALINDFGQRGWGGPCPPAGDRAHHYVFTLYALDTPHIRLAPQASPKAARAALQNHLLGTAQQTLLFGR